MRSIATDIELLVDELLKTLDVDVRRLQNSLMLLDELRRLVIKRDEAGLRRLLKEIQIELKTAAEVNSKRELAREKLAGILGWEAGKTTLSRLETVVSEEHRTGIAARRAQLMSLTYSLRTEYSRTAVLLSECTRFNRLLLDNILASARTAGVIYASDGSTRQQSDSAFVNMQF